MDTIILAISRRELKAADMNSRGPDGQKPNWRIGREDLMTWIESRSTKLAEPTTAKPVPQKRRRKLEGVTEYIK